MWKAAGLEEPSGRWRQDVQGGATWTGEDDGARTFEGDEAMEYGQPSRPPTVAAMSRADRRG